MAEIIKGAQYSIAFVIKNNGTPLIDQDVSGVRIALGNQIAEYPNGNLYFSSEDNTWRFPLTQKTTYAFKGQTVDYQSEVKIGNDIFPSRMQKITVGESMFRTEWGGGA